MTPVEVQDQIIESLIDKGHVQTWWLCQNISAERRQVYSALETLKRKGIIQNKTPGPKAALWILV